MRKTTRLESWGAEADGRLVSPAAQRNFEPIAEVLGRVLPERGQVLELASGSGQHIAGLARLWPGLSWQPSDVTEDHFASIRRWGAGLKNLCAPVVLNACRAGWGKARAGQEAVFLSNLLHLISAPEAETLLREAALALAPGGVFSVYGPFRRGGALVTEGDRAFDASLRARDPETGYKDAEWVEAVLARAGLSRIERVEMPAGNLMLIAWRPAD